MKYSLLVFIFIGSLTLFDVAYTQVKKTNSKMKYKSSGQVDFEALLIEGERKKPDMAIVTGNLGEKDSGLLKFRKDFLDVMADDFEEAIE